MEERFQAMVEKASDCFMIVDDRQRISYISPSVANVTGHQSADLHGQPFYQHIHPDDKTKVAGLYAQALKKQSGVRPITCRVKHQDGSWHTIEAVIGNLMETPAIKGIVINFRDVTERCLLEQQFQQAQKMETMGHLAGGVAHDFNNCLQSIEGLVDLLIQGTPPDSAQGQDLLSIKQAAQQAASVTRQLLAFSQRQVFDPRIHDLNSVVRNQQKMLKRLIGENIQLECREHPALRSIRADIGQLQQVIMNLVINARDAMPLGGHILIETDNVIYAEQDILPGYDMCAGCFVRLSVSDTGCGMNTETLSHIFEPFFTTKANGKGTGLGLSVVHGIVKQHEGWIHVYSTPGNGTEFKIYLPACNHTPTGEPKKQNGSLGHANGQRILLVEDDPATRIVTHRNLVLQGYDVRETTTLAEARTIFLRTNGAFELLLCDVVLPDGDGVSLTQELLALKPDLRVILTSGYADDKSRWREISRQGWHFLQKPYPFVDLFRLLDHCFSAPD